MSDTAKTGGAASGAPSTPGRPPMQRGPGPFGGMNLPAEKSMNFTVSAKRLIGTLHPERMRLGLVFLLAVISVSFAVLGPRLLGEGTNLIFSGVLAKTLPSGPSQADVIAGLRASGDTAQADLLSGMTFTPGLGIDFAMLSTVLMWTLVLYILSSVFAWMQAYVLAGIVQRTVYRMRAEIEAKINRLPLKYFDARQRGELLSRVTNDVDNISQSLQQTLSQIVTSLLTVIGVLVMMFLLSPLLALIALVTVPLTLVITALIAKRSQKMFVAQWTHSGTMSLGDVQAFIQYSRQFTQPLAQLGSMANVLQSGVASAERVFDLLDADEQSDNVDPAQSPRETHGRLQFEGVSFSYSADKPLIDTLHLVAEPGQTVAIVGPTGAGKTTLVNLMMRFYELDSGRILLDGVDVSQMTRRDLRSRMGMVLQDTWLFGGTIRENIAYGRPDATEQEIMAAARATYVDRFVHSLPNGYDTVLDDDGANVSAGEMQLLTIARAFLAKPSVLILDEATSSVDTRTEVLVQKAMKALRADRTSFVIAHRLSTIRDADLILVMESGRIVEQGTHDDLLTAGGAYHALYAAQFAAPVADEA